MVSGVLELKHPGGCVLEAMGFVRDRNNLGAVREEIILKQQDGLQMRSIRNEPKAHSMHGTNTAKFHHCRRHL